MNGVEAAASLFGTDVSNSDPFASLGDSLTPNAEEWNDHHVSQTRLTQDNHSTFAELDGGAQGMPFVGDSSQNHPPMQQGSSQDYGQHTAYTSSIPAKEYQNSEWHSAIQHQTASSQDPQANATFQSAYSLGSETISGHSSSQLAYNSYVSAAATTTTNAHISTYAPTNSTPEISSYHASTASLVQRTSVYTPATSTTYAASTSPNYSVNIPSLPAVNVPTPPAPAPASIIKRPKVSNAYDPPFPPPMKSKRVASRLSSNPATVYNSHQGGGNAYNPSHVHYPSSVQPPPIPTPEPPTSGMPLPRDDYTNDSTLVASVINLRHNTVDGLPRHDTTYPAYQPAWATQASAADSYGVGDKITEFENTGEHLNHAVGGGQVHHSAKSFSTCERKVEPSAGTFSPNISWRPQTMQGRGTNNQTSPKQSPKSSPPRARISSDYGNAPRTFSPEHLTEHVSGISHNGKPQVSPTAGPETRSSLSTNLYEISPTLPYQGMSSSTISQAPSSISPDAVGPPKGNRYHVEERRAASPGSQSIRSLNGRQSTKPQPGASPPSRIGALRGRSMSNGLSSEHYVPLQYPPPQLLDTEPGPVPQAPFSVGQPSYPAVEHPTIPQESFVKSQAPYAPSPSLLGTNDPLGRKLARAPVISFGFGGKLVACYHGSNTLNTGFDVALASRRTTSVQIHSLSKVIPRSTLDVSGSSFPGPLFSDPGASSSSLVRTAASGQKNKKAGVLQYLTERSEEISHGLGYLTIGSAERRRAEGKLVLVKLLKIMIENDGRLSGSPSIETSVRAALVPRLDGNLGNPTPEFTTTADTHALHADASSMGSESVISVNTLRSSSLDRIQEFLLRGERRQAYHYALDEKLWAHAMIIASSIDKEAWKEVITEFLRAELDVRDDVSHGASYYKGKDSPGSLSNGREALKVAYSLYSGQGPASIQELVPQTLLGRATAKLQVQNATPAHVTPRTPNFHPPPPTASIPPETLAKWAEIVAMMVSTTINGETSSALTALGDQLLVSQSIEAAHACYLLAPKTSLMGGLGNPAVRIVLVGSKSPAAVPNFSADLEPIIFSEIVEFALSLSPIAKGQEAFVGLPHLQAYRFIRAVSLAEIGEIQLANRYCEAISASLGRGSPYFTPTLLDQLRGLADRIGGTCPVDKSSSWMGSKIGKPSLDSIGGWLEGRFTKLVTGEVDSPTEAQERASLEERMFSGPFSTLSSASPSARSSPQPTSATVSLAPPVSSDSALAFSSPNSYNPVDRASSAMDYYKPKVATAPRVVSAGPAVTSFSQPQPRLYGQDRHSSDQASSTLKMTNDDNDQDEHAWWGGSSSYNYNDSASAKTPTATSFMRVDESAVRTTPDGFISLMDAPTFSATTVHDSPRPPTLPEEDGDEDLGLGNSRHKKEKVAMENGTEKSTATSAAPSEPQKPAEAEKNAEVKPPATTGASGSSWFSRLWKRDAAPPGPVKASLGEESSFYYDKELKRWVNKKTGADDAAAKPALPPPPSRAQTASPGMSSARLNVSRPPSMGANSTSAIDLTTSPPIRSTTRVRSNPAPQVTSDASPSPPIGMRPGLSSLGRPRSQASTKRNLRSRYVDVLQPETNDS